MIVLLYVEQIQFDKNKHPVIGLFYVANRMKSSQISAIISNINKINFRTKYSCIHLTHKFFFQIIINYNERVK